MLRTSATEVLFPEVFDLILMRLHYTLDLLELLRGQPVAPCQGDDRLQPELRFSIRACASVLAGTALLFSGALGAQPLFRSVEVTTVGLEYVPLALCVADLDGDGAKDCLACSTEAAGAMRELRSHAVGSAPRSLAAADFDGDGNLDIAVADRGTSSVIVLFRPAAEQGSRATIEAGAPPAAVLAFDWNGDGKQDLAVATRNGVDLYRGDGAGAFSRGRALPDMTDAVDLASGDLDGDGEADLVAATRRGLALRYSVSREGQVKGERLDAEDEFQDVLILDVDGDGRQDVVGLASRPFPRVMVNRAKEGGGFAAAEGHLTGLDPRSLLVADLDQDGRLDAVTANLAGSELRVLWGSNGAAPDVAFRRGDPAPPDPGPDVCGPDPTADDLTCESSNACP